MLNTPVGNIILELNGREYSYLANEIPYTKFPVDKRYKIIIPNVECGDQISIKISDASYTDIGPGSGERLEALEVYSENFQMDIGCLGEIENVNYEYINKYTELQITFNRQYSNFIILIAWLESTTDSLTNAWLEVDPEY
ncbi:MAG: hypothetical protein IJ717_06995 [Treponema sp.]|nr:hypothetical protein [Treponema sp.]